MIIAPVIGPHRVHAGLHLIVPHGELIKCGLPCKLVRQKVRGSRKLLEKRVDQQPHGHRRSVGRLKADIA